MNCDEARDKMSEYIDYQMRDEELEAFENHMKDCESCQNEFAILESMVLKLKNIEDIEPPSYLSENIMNAIMKEVTQKKVVPFRRYSLVASILAFFVVCGVVSRVIPERQSYDYDLPNARTMQIAFDDSNESVIEGRGIAIPTAPYNYEKNLSLTDEMMLFSHYVLLQDDMTLTFHFSNTSNYDIRIYLENSNGESVYPSSVIEKGSEATMTYSVNSGESDVFGIIISSEHILEGNFTVDIKVNN